MAARGLWNVVVFMLDCCFEDLCHSGFAAIFHPRYFLFLVHSFIVPVIFVSCLLASRFVDAHLPQPCYDDLGWSQVIPLLELIFPPDDVAEFQMYRLEHNLFHFSCFDLKFLFQLSSSIISRDGTVFRFFLLFVYLFFRDGV
jgi:hypothetical protein